MHLKWWLWMAGLVGALGAQASAQGQSYTTITNLDYAGTGHPKHRLDVLLPAPVGPQLLPVVVFIHGGGWSSGSKSGGLNQLKQVISDRYAGVSIDYRLTDEAAWPAQIHDCKAALRWIRANGHLYQMDTASIAVWGTSAGGHLAAMLGVSNGVESLEGSIGSHLETSSDVTCAVDWFGPSDLLSILEYPSQMDHDAVDSPESKLIGGQVSSHPEEARLASPSHYVSSQAAPFFIAHGDRDTSVPYQQSVLLHYLLEKAGAEATFIKVVGAGHGLGGTVLFERLNAFLDNQLLQTNHPISERPIPAEPDNDRDGLPDAWETAHGLNPAGAADADLDADSDGLDNRAEYLAGTHPNDPSSRLWVSQVAAQAGAALLTLQTTSGHLYRLQSSNDMNVWRDERIAILPPAGGGSLAIQISGWPSGVVGPWYYRFRVE